MKELSEDECRQLHAEALDMFKLYLKPKAQHNVGVAPTLVQEIQKSMSPL
jgi:hypothetical protein